MIISEEAYAAFAKILAPFESTQFLANYWGKRFLRLPGIKNKFADFMPWAELNRILEHHTFQPSQLMLSQAGKPLEPDRFTSIDDGVRRLKSSEFISCLANGATLILNNVNELSAKVGDLSDALQEVLATSVCVNLYAGWREERGLDLHWDPQDTLILQISGRKRWQVYGPTRAHPLKGDWDEPAKPSQQPVWDGIVEDGDAIYLPRGWWHVALPLNEPTLHLTVTIVPPTGVDLLKWVGDELKRLYSEFRMNVPHSLSVSDRTSFLSNFRKLVSQALTEERLLEQFQAEWEAKIPLRPRIRLPLAAVEQSPRIGVDTKVLLASGRRVVLKNASDLTKVLFKVGHVSGECTADLDPALHALSGMPQCVGELCAQLATEDASRKFMIMLSALAARGAIWVEPLTDSAEK